ncbi:hypothetical protein [Rhodosalinus sp.]|uniref:hypothetical protein n=1 Tax=Rhodosalinus sp. TaxID=2047741 RepID=UPI00397B423D
MLQGKIAQCALAPLVFGAALAVPGATAAQVAESGTPRQKLVTLVGIPSGTTAPHGALYFSLSGANRQSAANDDPDGSLSFGAGFGNADEAIGVQLSATLTSLTDDFGDSGYFGIKASRRLHAGENALSYVSLSADRIGGWGAAEDDDVRADLAFTTFTRTADGAYPVMLTLGAGTHRRDNETEPGLFAGAGIGLTPNFGASLAWTGETATLGASFRVDGLDNVYFTLAGEDIFDQRDRQRISFTASIISFDLFGG